jgi:hypothetical protein
MKNETGEPKFLQLSEDVWEQTKQNIEAINYIIGRFEELCGIPNDTTHNNGHWNVFRTQWHS